jgi:succinylarginine dihydrolase
MLAGNGPIRHVNVVDVRQSMANGGGPACLRLRVVADPATVDQRFMLDEAKAASLESVVTKYWPENIEPSQVGSDPLARQVRTARSKLLEVLEISELA